MKDNIIQTVKEFIIQQFLPGENPDALQADTPLISGGILDSVSILKLVVFIEESFKVNIEAHEVSTDYFETLTDIAIFVEDKSRDRT